MINKNLINFHRELMKILKDGKQIDEDTYKALAQQFGIPFLNELD
jgi:hypothetical protein